MQQTYALSVSCADTIKRVLRDYHERINALEDVKFDLEYAVKKKDFEVEIEAVVSMTHEHCTQKRNPILYPH